MDKITIANDAIDLFLEYRDKHGYNEKDAKTKALNEVMDIETFQPTVDTDPTGYKMFKCDELIDGVCHHEGECKYR